MNIDPVWGFPNIFHKLTQFDQIITYIEQVQKLLFCRIWVELGCLRLPWLLSCVILDVCKGTDLFLPVRAPGCWSGWYLLGRWSWTWRRRDSGTPRTRRRGTMSPTCWRRSGSGSPSRYHLGWSWPSPQKPRAPGRWTRQGCDERVVGTSLCKALLAFIILIWKTTWNFSVCFGSWAVLKGINRQSNALKSYFSLKSDEFWRTGLHLQLIALCSTQNSE